MTQAILKKFTPEDNSTITYILDNPTDMSLKELMVGCSKPNIATSYQG